MPDKSRHWESGDDPSQLTLDLPANRGTPARRSPSPLPTPAQPEARYLTRREAANYVRCSLRFFDGMGLPFIRKGRCKLYDRVDLDQRMQQDKSRGRAWKETLWPVNVDSTAARTRGTGGLASFFRTDSEYAEALGVSNSPMPKRMRSA